MSKPSITLVQTGLAGLGYSPGPADGIAGPKTRAAAAAWLAAGMIAAGAAIAPETNAMLYQGAARYPVSEIAVHCSATRPEWMALASPGEQVEEIRRWHMQDRGWRDIGYHWVIARNGVILAGRPEAEIGAGISGHNNGVIHICLIGGHGSSERDRFCQHFTRAQDVSLRQQIQAVSMRTRITRISGHNEYAAKACPGFTVSQWLQEAA